jgi:hypothetical protein
MARCALLLGFLVLACGGNAQIDRAGGGGGSGGGSGGHPSDAAASVCDSGMPQSDRVRVCAVHKVGPTSGSVDVALSGPVLATGPMNETSPCATSPSDTHGFWFEATDPSGEVWVLGASIPGVGDPLAVGDWVSAQAHRDGGGFTPTVASLSVRGVSGTLIAYAGEAGEAEQLAPPDGISVARGSSLCTKHDTCGDWSAYDLDVTAAGTTQTVPYASIGSVGPYRVAHGGCELQAPSDGGTTCADWFVARVTVGITPAP